MMSVAKGHVGEKRGIDYDMKCTTMVHLVCRGDFYEQIACFLLQTTSLLYPCQITGG